MVPNATVRAGDRPSVDAPFRAAEPLQGIPPHVYDSAMTEDCARVYFSGLGAVFYVQQL